MQSTTNYGYNLVEGTDLVNIPTQLNPNFSGIDSDLKNVSDSAITTATCVFASNIFNLTRDDPDRAVIQFTATDDYHAGDAFTVDGVVVVARKPNGKALEDDAFLVNNTVIGVLVGTVFNIFAWADVDLSTYVTSSDLATALAGYATTTDLSDVAGVWTTPITCAIGMTTLTVTNANIATTSTIDVYADNASGNPINVTNVGVSTGQVILTFDALEEVTRIKLQIRNI